MVRASLLLTLAVLHICLVYGDDGNQVEITTRPNELPEKVESSTLNSTQGTTIRPKVEKNAASEAIVDAVLITFSILAILPIYIY